MYDVWYFSHGLLLKKLEILGLEICQEQLDCLVTQ